MISPVSSPAYTPISSASKGGDVALSKAEMSTAEVALGAQTNAMKAAMEVEGQMVLNILGNTLDIKA